jgi:hypothetical protein
MPKKKTTTKRKTTRDKRAIDQPKAVELLPRPEDLLQHVPPRRQAKGGRVRLTNHKARSRWFQTRASWPVREAAVNRLVRERMRVEKALAAPANITASWECVGPTNIGGRITSLAVTLRTRNVFGPGRPVAVCGTAATADNHGNRAGVIRIF